MKSYLLLILLTGCAAIPEKVQTVNIPVPVYVQCKTDITPPELCIPADDSRVEWLRCELANAEINRAYVKQLEAVLAACR